MSRTKLELRDSLLKKLRVRWYIGPHYGHGQIVAVYSDGTCDVDSDLGPQFKGWSLGSLDGER